jgi:predicted AlkP superfamily pyrophosphatase or phosphodiesterase
MNQTGIRCILVFSLLFAPFSNGHAESTNKTSSSRTILISFDGAQPEVIEKLLEQRKLPRDGGFAELIGKGTRARGMTAVLPTLTATSHISIATGAYPERTNIPMNTFHDTQTALTTTTSGFSAPIAAETLWEAAKRQGKKVITIAFAGADGRGPDRSGDQTLGFGVRIGFSFVKFMSGIHFDAASADAWNLGSQTCEFKKANIGTATANQVFFDTFSLGQVFVNVLVCDSVFDGQELYDTAFFDFDKNLANSFIARMRQGDWAPFELQLGPPDAAFPNQGIGKIGAWVKLLAFEPDLSAFNIYLGDIAHNVGFPQAFVDDVDNLLGFWPAEPDFFQLEAGRIDEATYMEQLERLADYLKDAMLLAMENHDPDLLMGYQVQTDEAGHQFLLVDPRQQTFEDSAKRERYAEHIEKAYQIADRNLKDIIEAADLKKTNIIAVSDHGMAPMHTFVYPNRILRTIELDEIPLVSVIVTGTGAVNVNPATSLTNAVTSGGAANVYINLKGRESSGIVPPEQYSVLQEKIANTFKAINDPVTNEPVFSLVLKRPEESKNLLVTDSKSFFRIKDDKQSRGMQRDFHVFSEDTGDVLIVAAPGYHLDFSAGTATEAGNFFQPSTFFGQHGHDPRLPEMKAIFYAAGPDFKRGSLREVDAVDIAPTVADLLNIDPPEDAQGQKILTRDDHRR